jgi:hypothetical protein
MAIWVFKDGQREGPYQEQDLRELIYEGTYDDTDTAIRDGQFDWTTLGQILDLQPPPSPTEPPPLLLPPEEESPLPLQSEPPPVPAAPQDLPATLPPPTRITIADFQIPFGSMFILVLKWCIASLLALLILGFVAVIFWVACIGFLAVLLRH